MPMDAETSYKAKRPFFCSVNPSTLNIPFVSTQHLSLPFSLCLISFQPSFGAGVGQGVEDAFGIF